MIHSLCNILHAKIDYVLYCTDEQHYSAIFTGDDVNTAGSDGAVGGATALVHSRVSHRASFYHKNTHHLTWLHSLLHRQTTSHLQYDEHRKIIIK